MKPDEVTRLTGLFQSGRLQEALQEAERLRTRYPQVPFLYNMLGAIHGRLGQHKAALGYYNVAIQLKPDFAEAHSNLGASQAEMGMLTEALASHRRAVALQPGSATAQLNLGNVLAQFRHYDEAIECFRKAVLANPELVKAHLNLGTALVEKGEASKAIESLDRALALALDSAEAHYQKGLAFMALGAFDDSLKCFEAALAAKPDYADALSSLIFVLGYKGSTSPADLREKSETFGALAARRCKAFTQDLPATGPLKRLGFLSADFGLHPVGHFTQSFLRALLPRLQAQDIEVVLYSNRSEARQDSLTRAFMDLPCRWREVHTLGDRELVEQIRGDKVNILFDLSGHTAGHRLTALAARCAPVQVTWLGYFATTGIASMDYILGDARVTPSTDAGHFGERIATLPHSYLCFTAPALDLDVTPLPADQHGYVTFGCLNNLSKMGDEVSALWAQVLDAVQDSRLLLKSPQLDDSAAADAVRARYLSLGIEPDRLLLLGATDRREHLATYGQIDIALDPFPYPGGTTSCEAYWMGVPVINLEGFHFLSRVGESIAGTTGLSDWIAADPDAYVERAVGAAADLPSLSELRQSLRGRLLDSPLCNAGQFAEDFVATIRALWEENAA